MEHLNVRPKLPSESEFQTMLFLSNKRSYEKMAAEEMGLISVLRWMPGVSWFVLRDKVNETRSTKSVESKELPTFLKSSWTSICGKVCLGNWLLVNESGSMDWKGIKWSQCV